MKKIITLLALSFFTAFAWATGNPDDVIGVWKNGSGKGHIQIFKQSGRYYGKIIWLRNAVDEAGKPKVDRRNEDPDRRDEPLVGLVMLRDFSFEDGEWTDGHIYNPSDGKEYKGNIKMKDRNTLDVRGYVGISLFGKTDTWVRVK